tara:strand:+ start:205 stop:639 length:435 start_codon:yes stop_codon:yes gene_type:complete
MASQLKVNTLTGVSTAGSIVVTGEGNSTTTNLQQGLCKAWVAGAINSASPIATDSFNSESYTDVADGKTTHVFTNPMATAAGYTCGGHNADGGDITTYAYVSQPLQDGAPATTGVTLVHVYVTSNASGMGNYAYWSNKVHGDLA